MPADLFEPCVCKLTVPDTLRYQSIVFNVADHKLVRAAGQSVHDFIVTFLHDGVGWAMSREGNWELFWHYDPTCDLKKKRGKLR